MSVGCCGRNEPTTYSNGECFQDQRLVALDLDCARRPLQSHVGGANWRWGPFKGFHLCHSLSCHQRPVLVRSPGACSRGDRLRRMPRCARSPANDRSARYRGNQENDAESRSQVLLHAAAIFFSLEMLHRISDRHVLHPDNLRLNSRTRPPSPDLARRLPRGLAFVFMCLPSLGRPAAQRKSGTKISRHHRHSLAAGVSISVHSAAALRSANVTSCAAGFRDERLLT